MKFWNTKRFIILKIQSFMFSFVIRQSCSWQQASFKKKTRIYKITWIGRVAYSLQPYCTSLSTLFKICHPHFYTILESSKLTAVFRLRIILSFTLRSPYMWIILALSSLPYRVTKENYIYKWQSYWGHWYRTSPCPFPSQLHTKDLQNHRES